MPLLKSCLSLEQLLLTTSFLYGLLCCPSSYVAWPYFQSVWVSNLSKFIFHLVSLPLGMSFYVAWYHFRYVWFSMLSEFLCHLLSLPFCMGLYVIQASMSLGLTSVLYGSLYCPIVYVTWSHFLSVWVSMLSEFPCHLVALPFCMGICIFRVSMALGLTFDMYGSLCCPSFYVTSVLYWSLCFPSFYVTWSHFHYVWFSMLFGFLCHLVSSLLYMGLHVVRVSMSPGLSSILHGSLCCQSFYVTWFHFLYVVRFSVLVLFYLYVRHCDTYVVKMSSACYALIVSSSHTDIMHILINCKMSSPKNDLHKIRAICLL